MVKVTLESLHAMIVATSKRQDRMDVEMKTGLDQVKNRLPVWVTVVITILGSMVTGLLTKIAG
jgi:hypothetical protein